MTGTDGNDRLATPGITIPLKNPLFDSEANSYVWMSLNNIVSKGVGYLDKGCHTNNATYGRVFNLLVSYYLSYAFGYYSHEIAHDYYMTIGGPPKFRIAWDHWYYGVPKYIQTGVSGSYTREELINILLGMYGNRTGVYRAYILNSEVGLYQERFNAILASHYLDLKRRIDVFDVNSYLVSQIEDLVYILFYRKEEVACSFYTL